MKKTKINITGYI